MSELVDVKTATRFKNCIKREICVSRGIVNMNPYEYLNLTLNLVKKNHKHMGFLKSL